MKEETVMKKYIDRINDFITEHFEIVLSVFLVSLVTMLCLLNFLIDDPIPEPDDIEELKTYITKMDYKGHSYIVYKRLSNVAMCHDENCKCKEH